MDLNVLSVLRSSSEAVLEEMAFMFCELMEEDVISKITEVNWHCGSMDFGGPLKGNLQIAAGGDFCIMLAANILGTEPDEPQSVQFKNDSLKELLNVICGRFLSDAFGLDMVFNLSSPQFQFKESSYIQDLLLHKGTLLFNTEGEALVLALRFDD